MSTPYRRDNCPFPVKKAASLHKLSHLLIAQPVAMLVILPSKLINFHYGKYIQENSMHD